MSSRGGRAPQLPAALVHHWKIDMHSSPSSSPAHSTTRSRRQSDPPQFHECLSKWRFDNKTNSYVDEAAVPSPNSTSVRFVSPDSSRSVSPRVRSPAVDPHPFSPPHSSPNGSFDRGTSVHFTSTSSSQRPHPYAPLKKKTSSSPDLFSTIPVRAPSMSSSITPAATKRTPVTSSAASDSRRNAGSRIEKGQKMHPVLSSKYSAESEMLPSFHMLQRDVPSPTRASSSNNRVSHILPSLEERRVSPSPPAPVSFRGRGPAPRLRDASGSVGFQSDSSFFAKRIIPSFRELTLSTGHQLPTLCDDEPPLPVPRRSAYSTYVPNDSANLSDDASTSRSGSDSSDSDGSSGSFSSSSSD